MNYKKIYDSLVEKAKVRGLNKSKHDGYFEIHHIVPRCLGGDNSNENLVMFTGREHFIAHMLLWKIYKDSRPLFQAAWLMSNRSLGKRDSRLYESLRKQHAQILSERSEFNSPNFKDLTGLVIERLTVVSFVGWTDQARGKRTSLWRCQCSCGNIVTLKAKELSGKWAYKSCGCFKADQAKEMFGDKNPFFGREHSEASKLKMREKKLGKSPANKGKPMSEEVRQKVIASLKLVPKFPWKREPLKWYLADYYHELWISNKELTTAMFATLYNKLHNDCVSPSYFGAMLTRFKNGWLPFEDSEWLKFKDTYENSAGAA